MDKNERNEHFKGFAELLWQELMYMHKGGWIDVSSDGLDEEDIIRYQQIIAQRTYDLAYHAIEFLRYSPYIRPMQLTSTDTWIDIIPDLTSWPKTDSQSSAPDE